MSPLVWVVLLLALGLAVLVAEVFVPSGGVLGFVSVMAILAAVTTAFLELGAGAGLVVLAVVVVTVPVVLGFAFRWFPETPLGRRVLPAPPQGEEVVPQAAERQRLRALVGAPGRAVTELLPWGAVEVGGERLEALSDAGPLEPGTEVCVVGVKGLAVVVRPAPAPVATRRSSAEPSATGGAACGRPPGESLSPTLETFEFEQFEPPPA
ncbi:MAG: NfeD family protein [Pirellulales bacterium]